MNRPKPTAVLIFLLACSLAACLQAQSLLTVRIDPTPDGAAIPDDFCGLSFEISNLLPDKQGKYLFSAANADLIALFRAIGITNLRIGGGTADLPQFPIPAPADIDNLFAFAGAANLKIIYTVRLLNGNPKDAAAIAQYIQQHYAARLVCFQIGNEPDWHSFHTSPGHPRDPAIFEAVASSAGSAFPSFLTDWNQYASAITQLAPDAKFTGPDTGSNHPIPGPPDTDFNGDSWTLHFARAIKDTHRLLFVAQHDYVGESAAGVTPAVAIASMLSRQWVQIRYPLLFNHVLAPVQKLGLTYRMTEANDYTGGVDGASNAYASALWALDYLHWHAAHHAAGVNFHNKRWIFTDTLLPDPSGKFTFNPKAYAIKAFQLGAHGTPVPLSIAPAPAPDANLTAYAVRDGQTLFVTLLNKDFGPSAKALAVTIQCPGISGPASTISLRAPNNDVSANTGITLGGAPLSPHPSTAEWTPLTPVHADEAKLQLPAASATILRLTLK